MAKSIIPEVIEASPNRRSFVRKLGIAGAAVGAAATLGTKEARADAATDAAVLNFALNLEYLESEFYTYATTGGSITAFGIGIDGPANGANPTTGGYTVGGAQVPFSNNLVFTQEIANDIADDERHHVMLIRQALGSAAVGKPNINLGALGFGFGNQSDFLKLARIFEDIGVTAYGGAAPLLTPATVAVAAKILVAEAEHSANIRLQVGRLNIATAPPLDGVDILPPPSNPGNFFSLDANGLSAVRTPQQVLYLAYAAANAAGGGFFPDGVNGTFTMSGTSA